MQHASETAVIEPAAAAEAPRPQIHPQSCPQPLPEPATARALWPTFMRRTLSEDAVSEGALRPHRAQPGR